MNEIGIAPAAGRSGPAFLQRWGSRIAVAAGVAVLADFLVIVAVYVLGLEEVAAAVAARGIQTQSVPYLVIESLVAAPLIETLLMGWLILLMLDLGWHRFAVILASAALWALAHRVLNPLGWIVFIPFVGFSYLFIERNRRSGDGYTVATMCHFLFNAIAVSFEMTMRLHP